MTITPLKINRLTLDNGLRIVHNQDTTTAMAATNLMFDTGARDESPDLTGIAHLFEHLMFGGSANVDDFDGTLTRAGGSSNAWTSNDFTSFWNFVPAHNVETLFYLESDRLLRPALSEASVDVQRSVVIEEFKQQCLNRPYGRTSHHLRAMVYPETHPYSWPVIGKTPEHVAKASADDMRRWFERQYAPGNAVLAVTGNVEWDTVVAMVHHWFDDIPARPTPERNLPEVPDLTADIRREVTDNVPATVITLAWLTDGFGTKGHFAADAITDVLAASKASRFYQQLVVNGPGWFADVDAMITGSEHRGMLMVNARLSREDVDVDSAIDLLLTKVNALTALDPVSEHELQRLKNRQSSMFVLGNLDYLSRAQTLASAEIHHLDPLDPLGAYLDLTVDDITRSANDIFCAHHATLITHPEKHSTPS